jgi:hypothetical protein
MRRHLALAIVALALLVLGGCSTTCVVAHPDGNAASTIHSQSVHGNRYISVEPDAGQLVSPGIHDVTVKDNWFYDVVGVVTLGLYKPYEVTYRNVTPPVRSGGNMTPPAPPPTTRPGGH